MNSIQDLVLVTNGKVVATSFKVAEIFGRRHDNVLRDIENLHCSEEFRVQHFEETPYTHPQNGQTYRMFEMTKDGFSFLVMGYTGDAAGRFKEAFIKEFNNREAMLNSKEYIVQKALSFLQSDIKALEERINNDRPKVLFADAVSASSTSILIGELAKILRQNGVEIGQNRLFEWLRSNGYLIKRFGTDYNMPTQVSMDAGLFEIKETCISRSDGHISISKTPKVTGRGQQFFINKFLSKEVKCA